MCYISQQLFSKFKPRLIEVYRLVLVLLLFNLHHGKKKSIFSAFIFWMLVNRSELGI